MINRASGVFSLVVALVVCFVLSCQKEPETIAVTGVMLSKTSVELTEGDSFRLTATVSPGNATDKTIIWSSDNETVAIVSSTGEVVAKVPGIANISVKTHDGGMTATCRVTVVSKKISVSGVSLDNTTLTMTEGETQTLKATVTPEDATDKSVTWSSDNTSVADVTSTGVLVAKSPGTATITVKTNDGGKTADCRVTVLSNKVSVSGVSLDNTSLTMTEGETQILNATVTPEDATDKSVTWSSDNVSVADVSSTGVVVAKSPGAATITVKTNDGGKTATCNITVKANVIPVTGVSLNTSSMTLNIGQTQTLTATVTPSNATDKSVRWGSSDASIAYVDSNGKVMAISVGTATITATAGDVTAECIVTVVIPVTSVSLNKAELTLEKGKSEILTAIVSPSNATDKAVSWESSNTSVATVDQNGKVTAVEAGSTVITVTTNDGSKTATCNVTVVIPVTSISLNKTELALAMGQSETLIATIKPDDATERKITWTSSNKGVAMVEDGIVIALSVGNTTITASAGNQSASCSVVVYPSGSYIDEYGVNRGQGITISGITWAPVNCGYKDASGGTKGFIYGKLYQWGRNSGQGYGKPYFDPSDTYEDESTPNIASFWTGNNEDSDENTFYYGVSEPYNWINKNTGFWNGGTESTPVKNELYDPCPKGWRVPTLSELSTLAYGYHSDLVTNNGIYGFWYSGNSLYAESLTNKVFLPASGGRFADNWYHGSGASGRGGGGTYWSSSLYGDFAYNIALNGDVGTTYKAFGHPVRCCKEEVVQIVPISSLSFAQGSFSVDKGNQLQLTVVIKPENATCKAVFWSSSNTSVASVDRNGKVTAISGGSVTITAKAGDKQASCTVSITVPVTSVTLDKTELTIEKGKSETLTATVNPSNATDKTVTWKSSNPAIATVDQDGKVTAKELGNVVITVTTKDGSKTATCSVTVKRPANTEPIGDDGDEHGWD